MAYKLFSFFCRANLADTGQLAHFTADAALCTYPTRCRVVAESLYTVLPAQATEYIEAVILVGILPGKKWFVRYGAKARLGRSRHFPGLKAAEVPHENIVPQ